MNRNSFRFRLYSVQGGNLELLEACDDIVGSFRIASTQKNKVVTTADAPNANGGFALWARYFSVRFLTKIACVRKQFLRSSKEDS